MSTTITSLSSEHLIYIEKINPPEHPSLKGLREETAKLPMGKMQISPLQSHYMQWMLKALGVKRVLEIGAFTGYSALAMALALPEEGKVITCDQNKEWIRIGRPYWQEAGVDEKIEYLLGDAHETLEALIAEETPAFDFVFIDADKQGYPDYYEKSLVLTKMGGVIALDNVFLGGDIINESEKNRIQVMRDLNASIRDDNRVESCVMPAFDGVTLLRKIK